MRTKPIVCGIAGDSAAGRTLLVEGIVRLLGEDRVAVVCTNDYHRYDRKERERRGITPLHPACNRIARMSEHVRRLAAGRPVMKPVYDHATGTFGPLEYVAPKPFLIVEGLHAYVTPEVCDCLALKVFVAPPEHLRRRWKIERDTRERGYTLPQVLAELERREQDSARFVRPQHEIADVLLRFESAGDLFEDAADPLRMRLALRPGISHDGLGEIVPEGRRASTSVDLSIQQVEQVRSLLWERLQLGDRVQPADIGNFVEGGEPLHSETLALAQLVIASYLLAVATRGSRAA